MRVIFYSPKMDMKAKAVRRVLENVSHAITVEEYNSIDRLRSRIMRPLADVVLTLIRPSIPSDLESLVKMKSRFEVMDVIVMSSSENENVGREINELRPRFVFNIDDNPQVIGLILKKMIGRKKTHLSYWPISDGSEKTF